MPQTPDSVDVFLSYSRHDVEVARLVAEALQAREWSVFWDLKLRAGDSFRSRISEKLASARCVVVLWSSTSVNSDWVVDEASEGHSRKILVPAILTSGIQPPLGFRKYHHEDLSSWDGSVSCSTFLDLAKAVETILENSVTEEMEADAQGDDPRPEPGLESESGNERCKIELKLDRDFESYTEKERRKLLDAIGDLLDVSDVEVISMRPGSIRLVLRLPAAKAERLLEAVNQGKFDGFQVVDARLVNDAPSSERDPMEHEQSVNEVEMTVDGLEFNDEAFRRGLASLVGHRKLDVTLTVRVVDKFENFQTFRRRIVQIDGSDSTLSKIIGALVDEDSVATRNHFSDTTGAVSLRWTTGEKKHRFQLQRLLFLSHAGADSESAEQLVDLIQQTEEAKKRGLKVWFDKRDLRPGIPWIDQLDEAIQRATAFAVYVGTKDVIKWVHAEVQRALMRAEVEKGFVFVPILNGNDPEKLSGFVQRYQCIHDDIVHEYTQEKNSKPLVDLIGAVSPAEVEPVLEGKPYVGLQPFDEDKSHLFFGRRKETQELVDILRGRKRRLVMVVGDSGSGKSSLVRAGLVSAYRCGALTDPLRTEADESIWHVVKTRPRKNPFGSLADDLQDAATEANIQISPESKSLLRRGEDKHAAYDVIRNSAIKGAQILLVVDQFEELFTQSDPKTQKNYVEMLMHLSADPGNTIIRVVITMRQDYYNQCRRFPELCQRIEDSDTGAKFSVKKMDDDGLRDCITEPLKLAGLDLHSYEIFANKVLNDISEQPGELPLLQMALSESWKRKKDFNGDLLDAYVSVGGVSGALATVADEIFNRTDLSESEKEQAGIVFLRLAQLGDTGGVTKRISSRSELTDDQWELLRKLATEDFGRLVFVGGGGDRVTSKSEGAADVDPTYDELDGTTQNGMSVELAHDALITQWPRYLDWLQKNAKMKRLHDNLIPDAKKWEASNRDEGDLLGGNRLRDAKMLQDQHANWLSASETHLIDQSTAAVERDEQERIAAEKREFDLLKKQAQAAVRLKWGSVVLAVLLVLAVALGLHSRSQAKALKVTNIELDNKNEELDTRFSEAKQAVRLAAEIIDNTTGDSQNKKYLSDADALADYQTLRDLLAEKLDKARPGDADVQASLGNVYNAIGNIRLRAQDYKDALEQYEKALPLRAKFESERKHANVLMNMAQARHGLVKKTTKPGAKRSQDSAASLQKARKELLNAQQIREKIRQTEPSQMVDRDLTKGYWTLGNLDYDDGVYFGDSKKPDRYDPARSVAAYNAATENFARAVDNAKRLYDADTSDPENLWQLGVTVSKLAETRKRIAVKMAEELEPKKDSEARTLFGLAESTYKEAAGHLKRLVEGHAGELRYERERAKLHGAIASLHFDRARLGFQSDGFQRASDHRLTQRKILNHWTQQRPNNPQLHEELGTALVGLLIAKYWVEDPQRFPKYEEYVRSYIDQCADTFGSQRLVLVLYAALVKSYGLNAEIEEEQGRLEQEELLRKKQANLVRKLAESHPRNPFFTSALPKMAGIDVP